jgi:hypothetical protein
VSELAVVSPVKNKYPKIVARNIIVENIIVRAGKFKEKSVDVEIVQGIFSENATQQGGVCHCYK